ncbi:TIGR02647 family protein [Pseudoalteromonas xiamenensis]|uniref:TIGR02647 family protein n=1 Tax=Pseudoalteromonas xiamenensis TaxID=882626 RepID=A0A975DJV8_9GAMM|nr:TIGR02647 family protein [Pseudoalteromonas xiamenensis]QTH73067.1 TIGR02647 family protein [Pseudoalteromonas xiamenensis]WMN62207.1 TIGR02647 family protein [Pseudoalteromonas xiamenensis]
MALDKNMLDELILLSKFPDSSMYQGLKLHKDADPTMVAAADRLFEKGITDSRDGGYLTDLGIDIREHLDKLSLALK